MATADTADDKKGEVGEMVAEPYTEESLEGWGNAAIEDETPVIQANMTRYIPFISLNISSPCVLLELYNI